MKTCFCCKQEKPLEMFGLDRSKKDCKHSYCTSCDRQKRKDYYNKNKEKHAVVQKAWYDNNREKVRASQSNWHYLSNYGITKESFLSLAQEQDNKCKICSKKLTFDKKCHSSAVLDHCHSTGNIRGVLCNSCNTALGKFKDNITILEKAITYLKENQN